MSLSEKPGSRAAVPIWQPAARRKTKRKPKPARVPAPKPKPAATNGNDGDGAVPEALLEAIKTGSNADIFRAALEAAKEKGNRKVQSGPVSFAPDDLSAPGLEDPKTEAKANAGREHFDMIGLPLYIRTAIRRAMMDLDVPTGGYVAALARNGLHGLEARDEYSRWKSAVRRARVLSGIRGRGEVRVDAAIHAVRFELADPYKAGRCRLRIRCSEAAKSEITGAAEAVGLSASALAQLGLITALQDEDGVNPDFTKEMKTAVRDFLAHLGEQAEELELVSQYVEKL